MQGSPSLMDGVMKFVVPHTGTLQEADARVVRLAEFLGITCELFFLDKHVHRPAEYLAKRSPITAPASSSTRRSLRTGQAVLFPPTCFPA
jgi:hypothetical protein